MRSVLLVLGLVAAVAATPFAEILERAGCNADNCLRAIRNTNRPGFSDCSSFLEATFTPATSTVYATESFTATATATYEVTGTITNLVTATEVVEQTDTEVVTREVTVTIRPAKRQVTEIPSNIPTYAAACSGTVRYTSACFCLGATSATITVNAPTTVITLSETVTPTTVSEYITVRTDEVTVTDATQTVTTIVETKTVTQDVPVATDTLFRLKISFPPAVAGRYLTYRYPQYNLQASNVNAVNATLFSLAPNGDLSSGGVDMWINDVPVSLTAVRHEPLFFTNPKLLNCRITTANTLDCSTGIPGYAIWYCGFSLGYDHNPVWWSQNPTHPACLNHGIIVFDVEI